jgi:hypothetical protein
MRLFDGSSQPGRLAQTYAQIMSLSAEMKPLLFAGAALALLTAVTFSPAMAQGPKLSGGNTWPGISQRVDPDGSTAAATTPRSEWQYGYDKHAAWRGHWVLVR